jgi:DNA-directed RNA polymerase beta subunit
MDGILSANSTPFAGAVAIQRSLTLNPKLSTTRGFIPTIDQDKLGPENRLSAAEMLSFATPTRADPPRTAMEISQSKHGVPVIHATKQLLSSGMDRTIPYMISDKFCFKAKKDGKVDSLDKDNQVAVLKYDDGTYDAIDLKETLWKNSNSGFYINQESSMLYKEGESFKKGDVIAYNPSFFEGKGSDCYYTQGTLAKVAITAGDFVFEDSTYVTQKLCDWCSTDITMAKAVALGPNAIIHNIVKIGDEVAVNDELMNFTTSFEDSTTTKFLQDLMRSVGKEEAKDMGNEKILSKYSGRISDIDVYYNVPFETLSESLQKLILDYNKSVESRKAALVKKGIHQAALNLKTIGQLKVSKMNGTEFEGVLVVFYTTHREKLGAGDKITYSTALKGVISTVCPNEKAPFSEYRENEEICGLTASSGIPSRLTMDVFPQIYGNKLLIELGRWVHKTWNS